MSLHTNIGDEFFPIEVATPNQLTNYYESYVLIPNLGPLLYSRLYLRLKRIIYDFSNTIRVLDDIEKYHKQYNEIPSTPYLPHVLEYTIDKSIAKSEFNIEKAYTTPNIRQPNAVLRSLNIVGHKTIEAAPIAHLDITSFERMKDYKNILSEVSRTNTVITRMVNDNLMLSDEGIVSDQILSLSKKKQIEIMVNSFIGTVDLQKLSPETLTISKTMTNMLLANNTELSNYQAQMSKVVAVSLKYFFDIYEIVIPADHIKIVENCEWAFVRKEKVTIDLKRPLFRGPLSVNSVAPQSELTLTETESRMTTTGSRTLLQSRDDLSEYNSITSEVKSKLGTLFDYGSNLGHTMSEHGYSQDSMTSEKRTRVESALREISKQNSLVTLSTQTLSSSQIREYHTEGKDPKFATSELSFEVFSPVEVKHYLEDIGAVWCPRIKNPFSGLRASLTEYYYKTYFDYILENYVIDPLEPIPSYESVSRVTKDTASAENPGEYTRKVTFELIPSEINTGYLFGEDIQLEFHQHVDWYENEYEADDYWMKIINVNRYGGNSLVEVTVKYNVNNVWGNDPDKTWITVSIDKYKETEAYRQELQQYTQTVTKTNPARRNAIKVQARKYAALKRDELIRKYENNIEHLNDYAFTALIKKMFDNNIVDDNWSYYRGIIRSCIDWKKSRMDPEPCDVEALYENELSPYHFLNVSAVRFFLVIKADAETVFFNTMRKVIDQNWRSLFDKVEKYIKSQRDKFNNLTDEKKLLDKYDSELILGRHLEAILSNKVFSE